MQSLSDLIGLTHQENVGLDVIKQIEVSQNYSNGSW